MPPVHVSFVKSGAAGRMPPNTGVVLNHYIVRGRPYAMSNNGARRTRDRARYAWIKENEPERYAAMLEKKRERRHMRDEKMKQDEPERYAAMLEKKRERERERYNNNWVRTYAKKCVLSWIDAERDSKFAERHLQYVWGEVDPVRDIDPELYAKLAAELEAAGGVRPPRDAAAQIEPPNRPNAAKSGAAAMPPDVRPTNLLKPERRTNIHGRRRPPSRHNGTQNLGKQFKGHI